MFSDVDFGDTGAEEILVRAGSKNSGTITVMLDGVSGTEIGTVDITSTGAWQTYEDFTATVSATTGIHYVYLVFEGDDDDSYLFNVNYFYFIEGEAETSIIASATAGYGSITLDWTTSNIDIQNVQIMRDTDSDPSGRTRIGIASSTASSYTDTDVENGTTYYYWLKVTDTNGETYNSGCVQVTPSDDLDGTITFSTTTHDGYVTLEWSTSDIDIRNIQIYRDTDSDVSSGTTYYYWVKIIDGDSNTYNSDVDSATIASTTTTATLTKHGSGSSTQTIDLGDSITDFYYSWEDATTVTVSGMPDGITTSIDTDEQTVSFSGTPTESGTFSYTVTTVGADENVSALGTITINDEEEDAEQTIIVSATAGDGSVTLDWTTTNIDISNIQIMRDTDSDPSGRTRIGTASSTATSYTDSDVDNGTTYYYWVKIVDTDSNTYNSAVVGATPSDSDGTITLSATPANGSVTLDWTISDIDIRNIQIYRNTESTTSGRTRIGTAGSSATSYTDSDVTNDTTYYYWLKITDTDLDTHNSGVVEATPSSSISSSSSYTNDSKLSDAQNLDEESQSSEINAYPNPVNDILYINNASGTATLYNMTGSVI